MKKIISILILIFLYNTSSAQSDSNYLPIRLSFFEASANNNITKLHWATICYLQYANFEIQKSADGENFTTIHSFTADKFRCQQPFDFSDSSLSNTGKIFYRINVGSIDGKFASSAIRTVNLKGDEFDLISVYPTRVSTSLNFSLSDSRNESFSAAIITASGATVKKQQFQAFNGITKYAINTNNLLSGLYWLRVLNERGGMKTSKFIKY